jgi:DNA topoisomerase I
VSPRVRKRITALAIPPAWREVWICRSARGHLQATGVDAAGRKQYLYHRRWREERDAEKYQRIQSFAEGLPALRRRVREDLRRRGLDREKALAAVVRILDRTHLRVGSEEYARGNGTYGLATLRSRHLEIVGDRVVLDFEGKSGIDQHAEVEDPALAKVVAQMDEMPGYEVFAYHADDGEVVDVRSEDINAYIKSHLGEEFSAKDFRTWSATVAAAVALDQLEPVDDAAARRRAIAGVCRTVADLLGNTPAVCRSSYIDPRVIAHYQDGVTLSALRGRLERASARDLSVRERAVLALLRHRLPG